MNNYKISVSGIPYSNTVRDLKKILTQKHPLSPNEKTMKLVYAGKMLSPDTQILKDVFKDRKIDGPPVVFMIDPEIKKREEKKTMKEVKEAKEEKKRRRRLAKRDLRESKEERKKRIKDKLSKGKEDQWKLEQDYIKKYNILTQHYYPVGISELYCDGHVNRLESTNINPSIVRNMMFMPAMCPELNSRKKNQEMKNGNLNLVNHISFPIVALFPSILIYLLIFFSFLLNSGQYRIVYVLAILFLPFYYFEVKKKVVKHYEKQMGKLHIPYETEA